MTYQETIVPIMKGKNKGNKQYFKRLSIQAVFTIQYGMYGEGKRVTTSRENN